jgi:quercetin dioxygenase-like cupin family protein
MKEFAMSTNSPQRPGWVFNLHDKAQGIPRKLAEGIYTRIFPGANVMLSVVRLEPNSTGTLHSHPEEQWGVLLEGECVRVQDGVEVKMQAGDFWVSPGGVEHGIRAGAAGATVLDIFSPPREEYKKGGEGFAAATVAA